MKPTIIFDVDGVLINWPSQLPFFCARKGINPKHVLKHYTTPTHLGGSQLFGISDHEIAAELMRTYNLEHGKYMTAFTDAVECIPELAKTHNLVALTKFGNTVEHYTVRKFNLETFFPGCFSDLTSIDYNENKSDYIEKIKEVHGNVTHFVDDQLSYIEDVRVHHSDIECIHLNRYADSADVSDIPEMIKKYFGKSK